MDKTADQKPVWGDYIISRWFGWFVSSLQLGFYPATRLASTLVHRGTVSELEASDIRADRQYVIVSNHGNLFDPFLILCRMPFRTFRRLAPCRFFVYNAMFNSLLNPVLLAFGSFPARRHGWFPYGLNAANRFLQNRQTVLIFPEGKRNFGEIIRPHKGIAVLAAEPNVELIPVKITWKRHGLIPTYTLRVGRPFTASGWTPEQIMAVVNDLSEKPQQPEIAHSPAVGVE